MYINLRFIILSISIAAIHANKGRKSNFESGSVLMGIHATVDERFAYSVVIRIYLFDIRANSHPLKG